MSDVLTALWLKEYSRDDGTCVLCGGCGFIDTRNVVDASGRRVGRVTYCFCPNGRQREKKQVEIPIEFFE